MSLPQLHDAYISEQDYLEGEKISEIKHEYIDGNVYAMAGASKNHQRIIANLARHLGNYLNSSPCEVFFSDIKVRVDAKKYFYPDVIVVCENDDEDAYYTESPRIIVEVLSSSTRKFDHTLKRQFYQTLPSLEEYILIEQDFVQVEVYRKADAWQSNFYYLGDSVTFQSLDFSLSVAEIYQHVKNDDMQEFLAQVSDA
ncbi:MAG: Uma2 family endonuclease [Methylococcaceae bacterium]